MIEKLDKISWTIPGDVTKIPVLDNLLLNKINEIIDELNKRENGITDNEVEDQKRS